MLVSLGNVIEDVSFFHLSCKDLFSKGVFVAKEDCMGFIQFSHLLRADAFV